MITTILMDYDSTLHDMDSAMEMSLDGILGLSGKELYRVWVYQIHRRLIHKKYLEHHDDVLFHCKLLFNYMDRAFDSDIARKICIKFDEARKQARIEPIYYLEAVEALDMLKARGYSICLSTGYGAREKAETLERLTGKKYFSHIFSESTLGVLKTEPDFYEQILNITDSLSSETVSVGDTPLSDIRPAKLLGIRTIWVNRVNEAKPVESEQVADYEVDNLIHAVRIIDKL